MTPDVLAMLAMTSSFFIRIGRVDLLGSKGTPYGLYVLNWANVGKRERSM